MARTVKLELTANVSGLQAGLRTAQRATSDFARDLDKFQKKHEQSLSTIGSAAGKAGLAAAAGLAFVGKAAIDWESAWTGVLKTVDGTPEQLGRVEDGLRGLAKELPASHTEIAAVAEAAGQLGIQTDSVVGFTKVMIDLGESTNLSAEEAATSLARFSNIMGTSSDDVGKLGATLVGLGNNFATTESEIMDMSMRLAGASTQIGLSEGQTMGLAAAMSSVGIEAEAGGTAMSTTMKKIGKAVDTGGKTLDLFAKTAGMSAADFQTAWKDDAGSALEQFVLGLGRAGAEGESVNAILTELGITGIRESDALLRLSSAGELMGDSMKRGAEEYDSGMALIEEANKRYQTTEAKIKMAWNSIKDAAIEAGGVILPVVANIADAVGDLADWFGNLPGPVKEFLTVLGGVGAAAGLGVAGLIGVSRQLGQLSEAFGSIYGSGGRAQGAIKGVGKALTGITVVGAGLLAGKAAIEGINEAARSGRPVLEDYFNILATGGDLGGFLKGNQLESMRTIGAPTNDIEQFKNSIESLKTLNDIENPFLKWSTENLTLFSRNEVNNAKDLAEAMRAVGQAFDMGEVELGTKSLADMADQMKLNDQEVANLINSVPELKSALTNLATDQGLQIDPNDELGLVDLALGRIKASAPAASSGVDQAKASLEAMGIAADGTVDEIDRMLESLLALSTGTLNTRAAERQFQESIDAVNESIKTNGKSLDETTEKGRANQSVLDQVATSGLAVATSMAEAKDSQGNYVNSQEDVQKSLQSTYDATLKSAQAFTGNKKEAEALTRELLGIPEGVSVDTWMDTFARDTAEQTTASIKAIPGHKVVQIAVTEDGTAGSVQSRINEVTGKTEYVFVSDDGTVETVQAAIVSIDGKDVPVYVTDDGTVVGTQAQINGIKGKNVTITAEAATSGAESQLNHTARNRTSLVTQTVSIKRQISESVKQIDNGPITGRFGRANGGSVFGPGTETSDSIPAWLSTNEHVLSAREVRGLGGHGSVERLRAMARNGQAPAFATGGAVGRAEKRVEQLQRQYSRMPGDKKNRNRKLDLKDELDAAKKELKAVKASTKASEKAAKEAKKKADEARKAEREKQQRLSEERFDLRRDLKRGSITDSFTSGSGMSVVDRLFEQSNNKDLSRGRRSSLRSTAYGMESQLLKLEKRSDSLTKKLEKAVDKRDELLSAQRGVQASMVGAFDLGGLAGQKNQWGYDTHVGKRGLLSFGKSLASGAKKLSGKVAKLQKLGFNENMIQQVIDEWTQSGTFEVADAMLSMNKSERGQFNRSFRSLERYGLNTGESLTNAMSKGGIDAAEGLVKGLESKSKTVDNAFYKLGKDAEKAFKRSLGIKSPSRVMMAAGVNVGEGAELGILSKVGDVQSAAEQLMTPPSLTVPPSLEVSRHAQAQAMPAVAIDYDKLAAAMANVQVVSPVNIDKNTAARVVQVGARQASRLQ